ncbi:MAG: aldo/keto reductase [Nitrosopumilaceae archaeon]
MNQIALAYVLTRDEVSICIPGAKSVEQLESNVKSSEISINIEEIGSIQKIQQNW